VHHYTLGGLLDGHAAEAAASVIEPEAVERMRKLLDEMAVEGNVARVQQLDEEFHRVYYQAAGNPVLIEVMDRINAETRRIERAAFREPQIREQAHQEHIAILEALAAGDAEAAKAVAVSNWQNSWERIHAAIQPKAAAG
ncbi:MAG: GntR family transcriptional regulator, partial [Dehalococcoidia bacterium]